MARLLTLDTCSVHLRNALLKVVPSTGEAIILPGAAQSPESGDFKNVVIRVPASEVNIDPALFARNPFDGVSIVRVPDADARPLLARLATPEHRRGMLDALAGCIPSEIEDAELQVGPALDGDENDLDMAAWKFGFDSTAAFCGLFSADHSHPPQPGMTGMSRVHEQLYLVCRAGGGLAASTFHSRLVTAIAEGKDLDAALESMYGKPGAQGLRRVATAGTRNRGRILLAAAECLGIASVSSVTDQHSHKRGVRMVVPDCDVVVNTIRKLEDAPTWQITAGVDGLLSRGLATLSSASDGVVLFVSRNADYVFTLKNDVWNALPFASTRVNSGRALIQSIVRSHAEGGHPDADWVRAHFTWKNCALPVQCDLQPLSLWGSHEEEAFLQKYSRELGVDMLAVVRLRPQAVHVAGVEAGKLRAFASAVARGS